MIDKLCWCAIGMAAFFWPTVGCGGEDQCPGGSKISEPGVCHVLGGAGSSSTSTTTTSAGEEPQIGEPDDFGGHGGGGGSHAIDVGASGHGGAGGSVADAGAPDIGHPDEHDAGTDGGSSSQQDSGVVSEPGGSGGSGGGEQPTAGTVAPPPVDAGTPPTMSAGMTAPPPPPPPRCGDGHTDVDQGETCDGNCLSSCNDNDPCTTDVLTGDSSHCDAVCTYTMITATKSGDGCCPSGANSTTDSDCSASCGNGVKEGAETCDGNCPTSCDDGDPCTTDTMTGTAAQCTANCTHAPVTAAKSGDKCCPAGANANIDSDCKAICGNGVKESGEMCDGACPASCPADNGCTHSTLVGSANTCDAYCSTKTITATVDGDGCCPSGASYNSDNDCKPPSGCTEPSSGNMLRNPGFATGTSGWNTSGSYGSVSWSSDDYESCSISGSAQLSASNVVGQILSQCVPISGGTYHFSARIRSGGNGGQTTCAVVAYQLPNCQGGAKAEAEADWVNVAWGPMTSYAFDVDSTFTSASVSCYLNGQGADGAVSEVDMLYLGRDDAAF